MLLTGISANPLSLETSSLVASHMGTLLDLSADITKMTITYPSEPIMAIAAHKIISGNRENELNMFKILNEKTEAVVIDRGEMAEATYCCHDCFTGHRQNPVCSRIDEMLQPERIHKLFGCNSY